MSNDAETIWVVFNGELYNYVDLRCELQAAGHHLRTKTDTEVLVHLYELYGDEFVGRLRGMFAFAIWDEPGQRLLLCRDRVGIKPLYHRTTDAGLEFASEVRALARATDRLDVQAIASYLRLGWIPGPGTVYSQIKELPPAHLLRWEDGSTEVRRYWSPPFAGHKPSAPTVHALAQVLEDAVRRHLVADVPVGLFLSSGVDSAVVAELARRTDPAVRSYTVTFDTGEDEGRDASALARKLGLDHTLVQIGGEEILCSLDRFIADMDQPSVDGLNSWIISGAVRDAGLVVALSGLGGDELFGGYSTFRHVPRLAWAGRAMCWLPDHLWQGVQRVAGSVSFTQHSRARRALEAIARGGTWEDAYSSVRGLMGVAQREEIWIPTQPLEEPIHIALPWNRRLKDRAMVAQLELANYLPYQLLRDTDCMSMAHSLEVRVPLLDDAVIELAIRGQCSNRVSWSKHELVAAVNPALMYFVDRPKRTFTLPLDQWMRGPLRGRVLSALAFLGEAEVGFDRRQLTALWDDFRIGRVGWRLVWALAVLGMWIELHGPPDGFRDILQ